jgi:hypothetical protein
MTEPSSPKLATFDIPLQWLIKLVPEAEKDDASVLLSAASALSHFVLNLGMAVKLFDMASVEQKQLIGQPKKLNEYTTEYKTKRAMYGAWKRIAARDGAIQIYHLGTVINSIRKELGISPSLVALIDAGKLKIAKKLLDSYFPNYQLIRNAVAHSFYEVAPNKKKFIQHTSHDPVEIPGFVSSNAENIAITDSIKDRNYIITFKGKIASYEISDASHTKLELVLKHCSDAFDRARSAYQKVAQGSPSTSTPLP